MTRTVLRQAIFFAASLAALLGGAWFFSWLCDIPFRRAWLVAGFAPCYVEFAEWVRTTCDIGRRR